MTKKKEKTYEWELIFVMPNLRVSKPFDADIIAIVPFEDRRLEEIRAKQNSAEVLLNNFKNVTGKKIKPSALIWRKDAPMSVKNNEAVVAFRNALAISSLVYNCSISVKANNVFGPVFSDHFDFYPVTIGKRGGFHISSPALEAYGPKLEKFYGNSYPHLPNYDLFEAKIDELLADKIIKLWNERFYSPAKDTWDTRLLFRSLEIAYQSMITPFRNNSTIYEYGTNLALWVSAFEILVHKKPDDKVGCRDICEFLGKYKWPIKRLRDRRFILHKNNKTNKVTRGNLVQKLYKELYEARCDFLHGNQVKKSRLYPFHNKNRPPLVYLAPSIYWTALSIFLPSKNENKTVEAYGKTLWEAMHKLTYEEALLSAIGVELEDIYTR